jgi:hypothetical protein
LPSVHPQQAWAPRLCWSARGQPAAPVTPGRGCTASVTPACVCFYCAQQLPCCSWISWTCLLLPALGNKAVGLTADTYAAVAVAGMPLLQAAGWRCSTQMGCGAGPASSSHTAGGRTGARQTQHTTELGSAERRAAVVHAQCCCVFGASQLHICVETGCSFVWQCTLVVLLQNCCVRRHVAASWLLLLCSAW